MKVFSAVLALSLAFVHVSRAGVIVKRLTPVVQTPISFSNYTLEWKSLNIIMENAALFQGNNNSSMNGTSPLNNTSSMNNTFPMNDTFSLNDIHLQNNGTFPNNGTTPNNGTIPNTGSPPNNGTSPNAGSPPNNGTVPNSGSPPSNSTSPDNGTTPKNGYPNPAYELLQSLADEAVQKPVYTIVNKPFLPPSGNKHDWLSYAPYWWPSPNCTAADKDNDCPFVREDGQIQPDVYKLDDQRNLEYMSMDTETLAIAYTVFKKDAYAQQAANMLRAFFLDPATLMNPNMEYGQIIRGNGKSATHIGRAEGIISARALISPIRAIKLLELTKAPQWGQNDTAGMVDWFSQFQKWLLDDPIAIDEGDATNNHLSYYVDSLITFSDFIGDYSLTQSRVETFFNTQLPKQITANGSQPMEESRTLPFHYSAFNLDALTYMADFVSQSDPINHGPFIPNAWNEAGDSIVSAVQRLIAVVAGKTGQIEPGADLSEADPPVRAVTVQYPSKFCHTYKGHQSIVPYNNLWPLWTPQSLWNCFS